MTAQGWKSDTPRMDTLLEASEISPDGLTIYDLTRQLERELAEKTRELSDEKDRHAAHALYCVIPGYTSHRRGEEMSEHIDGSAHHWELHSIVNQLYQGTAIVKADAIVICHRCGAWKVVPQESYNPTTGDIAQALSHLRRVD